jgi:TonB family protein
VQAQTVSEVKGGIPVVWMKVFQAVAALFVSYCLFMIIPLAHIFFRSELALEEARRHGQQLVLKVEMRKEPPRQNRPQQMRRVTASTDRIQSRSLNMKFTPDLGLGAGGAGGVEVDQSNLENMIFEEGQTEEPPSPLYKEVPPMPDQAREMGIGGSVEMILVIGRDGKVATVDFVRVPHASYKRAVLASVLKWRFRPARHKGVPVQIRVRQVIEFKVE